MANLRKKRTFDRNSTELNSAKPIDEILAELTRRLENVEARLDALESNEPADPFRALTGEPQPLTRGRRSTLRTAELLERRNALIYWLEDNWPELSMAVRRARSVDDVIAAVKNTRGLGTHPYQPEFYQHPERFKEEVWGFLKSRRYGGDPRQFAAAMAGLPRLSWRRSLDICSHHDTAFMPLNPRAYWDYLRRNFPDRLRELAQARTPADVKRVLKKSRTADPVYRRLLDDPEGALSLISKGKPRE